ncbi:MAG: hypothetical protein J6N52_09505 [Clostridia bacterium]|nr:hypothetical protein [Clostridia bacterium]
MILIKNEINRYQKNFWNNCLFHPTDAIEDSWGKRILDRMSEDKSIDMVRIYTMFEDIVYIDGNGDIAYDFRLTDLRLDYMVEKGYKLLLAYGMMPECIAVNKNAKSCVSKNKTRYKGKLINTSIPVDYKIWEEICYTYTKHIIDRYGIEVVSEWRMQCMNEADDPAFFMSDVPIERVDIRLKEYCKLYTAFANGLQRASDKVHFGGPAAAFRVEFLSGFLDYVKENNIKTEFVSLHNYAGMEILKLRDGLQQFDVENWIRKQQSYIDVISEHGFSDSEIIVDEWGMISHGFFNIEECPPLIARETEVFSSYFVKLIYRILEKKWKMSRLMICLSGQHEMVTDFSGFRNFFTLNFFAKPIYNAFILGSKLHEGLLDAEADNENIFVIPTESNDGKYAVLMTYCSENFKENLPEITQEIMFDENINGKKVDVFCIDRQTTNPYRLYERMGIKEIGDDEIKLLKEEGQIKPISSFVYDENNKINLTLTANSVYLIEVK